MMSQKSLIEAITSKLKEAVDFQKAINDIKNACEVRDIECIWSKTGDGLIGRNWKIEKGYAQQPLMFSTTSPKLPLARQKALQAMLHKKDWTGFAKHIAELIAKGKFKK